MLYANRVVDKSYSLLKQNWSAPTVMTVIICFFMLLIHPFETIGILNGNRNIEIRIQSPENLIKTYNMQSNAPKIEYNEMIFSEKNRAWHAPAAAPRSETHPRLFHRLHQASGG